MARAKCVYMYAVCFFCDLNEVWLLKAPFSFPLTAFMSSMLFICFQSHIISANVGLGSFLILI
jgi:hypothetical protein